MTDFSVKTPEIPPEYSDNRVSYHELAGHWQIEDETVDNYANHLQNGQNTEIIEEIPKNQENTDQNPQNPPQIPLFAALLAELRRVRNQVIPAYYHQFYDQNTDLGTKDGIVQALHIINGTISAAEHAMMDQDLSSMLAAHHQLRSFGFSSGES